MVNRDATTVSCSDIANDCKAESYYTSLPDSFDVVSGSTRRIHFDNSGAVDHFADNAYSLYHTSMNGLEFSVTVSAGNAAPQTVTVL